MVGWLRRDRREPVKRNEALHDAYDIVGDGVARANLERLLNRPGFQESVERMQKIRLAHEPSSPETDSAD